MAKASRDTDSAWSVADQFVEVIVAKAPLLPPEMALAMLKSVPMVPLREALKV